MWQACERRTAHPRDSHAPRGMNRHDERSAGAAPHRLPRGWKQHPNPVGSRSGSAEWAVHQTHDQRRRSAAPRSPRFSGEIMPHGADTSESVRLCVVRILTRRQRARGSARGPGGRGRTVRCACRRWGECGGRAGGGCAKESWPPTRPNGGKSWTTPFRRLTRRKSGVASCPYWSSRIMHRPASGSPQRSTNNIATFDR